MGIDDFLMGIWVMQIYLTDTGDLPHPGDLSSWESPPTLLALPIRLFEYLKRLRNLKFSVRKITNIQGSVLRSCKSRAAVYFAFKQSLTNN